VPASELEGCVLGLLWKQGPCTAYAIRRSLLGSPSSHWSGSAGAIYPLLRRFEERGLATSRKTLRGDRAGWQYALTAAGRERFLAWLGPPMTGEVVAIAADPLRTRAHFLGALPPKRRAAFLAAAKDALERHLGDLAPRGDVDRFDRLALRSAVRVTQARLAWLAEVGRSLDDG
jgi:DNA-binding PadR family transcriptional regulator